MALSFVRFNGEKPHQRLRHYARVPGLFFIVRLDRLSIVALHRPAVYGRARAVYRKLFINTCDGVYEGEKCITKCEKCDSVQKNPYELHESIEQPAR